MRSSSSNSDFSLLKLLAISALAGLVIVAYVLIIVQFEKSRKQVEPIELAALMAAEEIKKISVADPRFGLIGLCDTNLEDSTYYAMEPTRIRSLNSIYASIKAAAVYATRTNNRTILSLANEDLEVLERLKSTLQDNLSAAVSDLEIPETEARDRPEKVEQEDEQGQKNQVFMRVYDSLKRNLPSNTIIAELKITLGLYGKSSGRATSIKVPDKDREEAFAENGFYRENIAVPVTAKHQVNFYKVYDESRVVPANGFVLKSESMLPGAILVEATFKHRYSDSLETKSSCCLIGAPEHPPQPTCLTIRCPQGIPESMNSISKFLDNKIWLTEGNWAQATGGEVPGEGHLNPTIDPVLSSMRPDQAISAGIYSWIKEIVPPPSTERIEALVNSNFLKNPLKSKPLSEVNSCLAVETGARERAFLNATMPGNSGQKALANCFEFPDKAPVFPYSALPIMIDRQGNATLAGKINFDKTLIQNYLYSIFSTNLAAIETMSTARTLSRQYQSELKTGSATPARVKELKQMIVLARRAGKNGLKIAEKSFDMSSRNFSLLRNGLHSLDKPNRGYLLSRQLLYTPAEKPLTEEDLLSALDSNSNNSDVSVWLQEKARILVPWKERFPSLGGIKAEGKPLDMVLAEDLNNRFTGPITIIFDSRDFETADEVSPHLSSNYPFAAQALPEEQSIYYCVEALKTGKDPDVLWSVLLTNNSFHKSTRKVGSSNLAKNRYWCQDFDPPFSICPRPVLEIQLRRPLPRVEEIPRSTLVTDPRYDRKVPLVPPIPAEMM